jgi:hypothetical protein
MCHVRRRRTWVAASRHFLSAVGILVIRRAAELRCQTLHVAAVPHQVLLILVGHAVHLMCLDRHRRLMWRAIEDTNLTADHRKVTAADMGVRRRHTLAAVQWEAMADRIRAHRPHTAEARIAARTEIMVADALPLMPVVDSAAGPPETSAAAEATVADLEAEAAHHLAALAVAAGTLVEAVVVTSAEAGEGEDTPAAVVATADIGSTVYLYCHSERKFPSACGRGTSRGICFSFPK